MFVLDCSGTMKPNFDFAKGELKRAIDQLSADQAFNVVFDTEDKRALPAFPRARKATDANKRAAHERLDDRRNAHAMCLSIRMRR